MKIKLMCLCGWVNNMLFCCLFYIYDIMESNLYFNPEYLSMIFTNDLQAL